MLHFSTVTCVKDKHNSSFKVLSSLVYLRGKSASWLKIPAGSNSWLLILKWSEEVSTDHTDRTEEAPPEWRVQVMKLRGYDSFQRNMQIYTLMHRGEGDVNHLNAKYKDWYRLLNRVWTNMRINDMFMHHKTRFISWLKITSVFSAMFKGISFNPKT